MTTTNPISGTVATVPGKIETVTIDQGSSVADLMEVLGMDVSGRTLTLNGVRFNPEQRDLSTVILEETNFQIIIVGAVKGN